MNIPTLFQTRFASPLPAFRGFTVSGPDANGFLQGQLTNDVLGLAQGRHQRTGYCTAKGRLLATMLQWRMDDQTLGHLVPTELFEPTIKRLRMYVLRAKASFLPAPPIGPAAAPTPGTLTDQGLHVAGLWGGWTAEGRARLQGRDHDGVIALEVAGVPAWLIAEQPCPVLGERVWLVGSAQAVADALKTLGTQAAVAADAWLYSEILNAKPWVWASTLEAFVPQMINLELIHGVSFTKGCYPGQEVVARSQYLGKLKRRTFRADLALLPDDVAKASDLVGRDVWSAQNSSEPCGVVVAAASAVDANGAAHGSIALLVEVSLQAWEAGSLRVAQPQGPELSKAELPYAFPTQS